MVRRGHSDLAEKMNGEAFLSFSLAVRWSEPVGAEGTPGIIIQPLHFPDEERGPREENWPSKTHSESWARTRTQIGTLIPVSLLHLLPSSWHLVCFVFTNWAFHTNKVMVWSPKALFVDTLLSDHQEMFTLGQENPCCCNKFIQSHMCYNINHSVVAHLWHVSGKRNHLPVGT